MPIKGNSVVLRFQTAKVKHSKAEKALLAKFMDDIDALLYDPSADAAFYGSLEGDDRVDWELRLFLSCPNADALVEKLRPWLERMPWKGPLFVMKRYGVYTDS